LCAIRSFSCIFEILSFFHLFNILREKSFLSFRQMPSWRSNLPCPVIFNCFILIDGSILCQHLKKQERLDEIRGSKWVRPFKVRSRKHPLLHYKNSISFFCLSFKWTYQHSFALSFCGHSLWYFLPHGHEDKEKMLCLLRGD
jgi:hypothetical protein